MFRINECVIVEMAEELLVPAAKNPGRGDLPRKPPGAIMMV
jgi:hypothetical protein